MVKPENYAHYNVVFQKCFEPHLTLGKVKNIGNSDIDFLRKKEKEYLKTISFLAEELHLVESILSREGTRYIVRKSVKLKKLTT